MFQPDRKQAPKSEILVERRQAKPGKAVRYEWRPYVPFLQQHRLTPAFNQVECCHCHRSTPIGDVWTTVLVDASGKPRSGFLHCRACMLHGDAELAWKQADSDTKRRAANGG